MSTTISAKEIIELCDNMPKGYLTGEMKTELGETISSFIKVQEGELSFLRGYKQKWKKELNMRIAKC